MAVCPNCGKESSGKFCDRCGTPLAKTPANNLNTSSNDKPAASANNKTIIAFIAIIVLVAGGYFAYQNFYANEKPIAAKENALNQNNAIKKANSEIKIVEAQEVDYYKTPKIQFSNGDVVEIEKQQRGKLKLKLLYAKGVDFKPIVLDGNDMFAVWSVTKITTADPALNLIEVIAVAGNVGIAQGYWLFGIKDGEFVTFISPENFQDVGCPIPNKDSGRRLTSELMKGQFVLKYAHIEEGQYGYQRKFIVDNIIKLEWDDATDWFYLKNTPNL